MIQNIRNFFHNLNRLPMVGPVILLMLITGFTEGIGISMMMPILSFVTNNSDVSQLPFPFSLFPKILEGVGLEVSLGSMIGFTAVVILISFFLTFFQERVLFWCRYEFLRKIRTNSEKSLLSSNWKKLSTISSGDIANRLSNQSQFAAEAIMAMAMIIAIAIQTSIYAVFAFILSIKMSILAFTILGITALLGMKVIARVKRLGEKSTNINNKYGEQLVDYLKGIKLIKATGSELKIINRLAETNKIVTKTLFHIGSNQALLRLLIQSMVSSLILLILYVSLGVFSIPISIVLIFLFILMRFNPKILALQAQYHNYVAYTPAIKTVDELISEGEKYKEVDKDNSQKLNQLKMGIIIRNLSFKYPDQNELALNNINLYFPAKKMTALVGSSGGGKSTLIDLLIGLHKPLSGSIEIDNISMEDLNLNSWRKKVGYVTQDNISFNTTIRNNLTLSHEVSDEVLWNCLNLAHISEYVKSLPEGLNSEIGENGVKLSGGQKQRISLARALVGNPEVLLLDEATSALDNESEKHIQIALENVSKYFSIIIVAHRLSTVRKADTIYVIENGEVIEQGNYSSLLENKGRFSELHEVQFV